MTKNQNLKNMFGNYFEKNSHLGKKHIFDTFKARNGKIESI
jgi:hypothetical protein